MILFNILLLLHLIITKKLLAPRCIVHHIASMQFSFHSNKMCHFVTKRDFVANYSSHPGEIRPKKISLGRQGSLRLILVTVDPGETKDRTGFTGQALADGRGQKQKLLNRFAIPNYN